MDLKVISIILTGLLAIIGSLFQTKNENGDINGLGYTFIIFSLISLSFATYSTIDDSNQVVRNHKSTLDEIKKRHSETVYKLGEQLAELKQKSENDAKEYQKQLTLLRKQGLPPNSIVASIQYTFDSSKAPIKELKNIIWQEAFSNRGQSNSYSFNSYDQLLVIRNPRIFYSQVLRRVISCLDSKQHCINSTDYFTALDFVPASAAVYLDCNHPDFGPGTALYHGKESSSRVTISSMSYGGAISLTINSRLTLVHSDNFHGHSDIEYCEVATRTPHLDSLTSSFYLSSIITLNSVSNHWSYMFEQRRLKLKSYTNSGVAAPFITENQSN